jgi:hypothetical protein
MNLNAVRVGDFTCVQFYKNGKAWKIHRGQVMHITYHFLLCTTIYHILCFHDRKIYKTRDATK